MALIDIEDIALLEDEVSILRSENEYLKLTIDALKAELPSGSLAMGEPRRWTIRICEACGKIRGPYCPGGAGIGMEECEVIEVAPVEAELERTSD